MTPYATQGLSNDEIAPCFGTRREVVSLWRKHFFTDRLAGLLEQARPGRPRTFPPEFVWFQFRLLKLGDLGHPISAFDPADKTR